MKYLIAISALMLAVIMPVPAFGYDIFIDGIYFNLDGDEATVTHKGVDDTVVASYFGEVTIPATISVNGKTYTVTTIGTCAFCVCKYLTSINLPNTITKIGNSAFSECGITSIDLPNSITTIEDYAFANSKLKTVYIPSSVKTIGSYAFSCEVSHVNITDVEAWCNIIFRNQYSNPLNVAHHLYLDGEEVINLIIPSSVTSIGDYAFEGCNGFKSISFPNTLTSIGNGAFDLCYEITEIDFPNSLTTIGNQAFMHCSKLTSITIPNSVSFIGNGAFNCCYKLANITVENDNLTYDSRNNCNAIIETASNTLIEGCLNTIIPNSVTAIGDNAFYNCNGLKAINIPNSVKTIGQSAFISCSGLSDVYSFITDPTYVAIGTNSFYAHSSSYYTHRTLHVPYGTLANYQSDSNWSDFFGTIVEMNKLGDLNGDGTVDVDDVTALISKVLGDLPSKGIEYASDLNGDNSIDIDDIIALIAIILNGQ